MIKTNLRLQKNILLTMISEFGKRSLSIVQQKKERNDILTHMEQNGETQPNCFKQ